MLMSAKFIWWDLGHSSAHRVSQINVTTSCHNIYPITITDMRRKPKEPKTINTPREVSQMSVCILYDSTV